VGRSGTFIALGHLLGEPDAGTVADVKDGEDMVFDTVNKLREQRMMMVQSDAQYLFLYEVLRSDSRKSKLLRLPRFSFILPPKQVKATKNDRRR
jgi:protein tyrosine phosphatase